MKIYLIRLLKIVLSTFSILIIGVLILFFIVSAPPNHTQDPNAVNDVTQLNPINVKGVYRPDNISEIISLVRDNSGPISIGGARHSMGGQIGTEGSIHLDMRSFDQVISFSKSEKEITVQSGITWRKIQEYIDPYNLSVSIMQTYSNFTVGGSLSVNVHGRYVGQGPIVNSGKSLKIVLANGQLLECSRQKNAEIFFGCIGGYGGLGVIVEVTLFLTDNCKVSRTTHVMPLREYKNFFLHQVHNDSTVVFHNADIYPDEYNQVRAVSYYKTDASVTVEERLTEHGQNYRAERFGMWLVSEMYGGKWIRRHIADPIFYSSNKVVWRNYEASYDALELEPASRKQYTYVLQEYFVPMDHFDAFVSRMAEILQRHEVNVINISIRHTKKDEGSVLAWANTEVFSFVMYYKQGTREEDKRRVGEWTRDLIDAAIENEGSYYLPYQLHATEEQFRKAYPKAEEFFALKYQLDPTYKFRNKLWDKYCTRLLYDSLTTPGMQIPFGLKQ